MLIECFSLFNMLNLSKENFKSILCLNFLKNSKTLILGCSRGSLFKFYIYLTARPKLYSFREKVQNGEGYLNRNSQIIVNQ